MHLGVENTSNHLSPSDTGSRCNDPVMDIRAAQALVRFGLGRRGGEGVPGDPAGWLQGQVTQDDPGEHDPGQHDPGQHGPGQHGPAIGGSRPTTANGLTALRLDRGDKPPSGERRAPALYRAEAAAALENALATPAPFRERLVWFWANHFTLSVRGAL